MVFQQGAKTAGLYRDCGPLNFSVLNLGEAQAITNLQAQVWQVLS